MEKVALVLAGGGSRGSYQIGVWQALTDLNISVDIVTGTSVGALNAALIAMGDLENATNMWKMLKTSMILSVELDESLPVEKQVVLMVKKFFEDYVKQGGTDSYPLKKLINDVIDETAVRGSRVECGFVMVDKGTFKPLELYVDEIDEGQMGDYLLASASLFPAIKSCKIGESNYIDGAYYDNLPVELALKRGATKIIAVDLEAIGIKRNNILKQVTDITIIKSGWDLGPLLVFDKDTIFRNIRLGYLDTMKSFGVFSGMNYTFVKNDISVFARKNKSWLRTYNEILNVSYGASFKNNMESLFYSKMLAHLKSKYDKSKFARESAIKYSNFLTACMEAAGQIFSVDPTKIYTYDSFSKSVFESVNMQEIPLMKPLSGSGLKYALSLLDKKVRTVYLAYNIKNAIAERVKIDSLALALFLPEEFLAAYYLALLD